MFFLKGIDDELCGFHRLFILAWTPRFEPWLDVFAIGKKGITEPLRHEEIAAKDAT